MGHLEITNSCVDGTLIESNLDGMSFVRENVCMCFTIQRKDSERRFKDRVLGLELDFWISVWDRKAFSLTRPRTLVGSKGQNTPAHATGAHARECGRRLVGFGSWNLHPLAAEMEIHL